MDVLDASIYYQHTSNKLEEKVKDPKDWSAYFHQNMYLNADLPNQ